MGADAMVDIPGWLTAVGTVVLAVVPLIGAAHYVVVRPLAKRMDGIEEKATERQDEIRTRLTDQDKATEALKTSIDTKLVKLDSMFREHEKDDGERFDEAGEKLESQIAGLRRDVATEHRNDIGALGQRIDNLVGKVIETLAMLAGRKGSHSGAD
jgi:hypothetical protein